MPIDVAEVASPGWWLKKLASDLAEDRDRLDRLNRYYIGDPDLPDGEGARQAWNNFQSKARTNFPRMVVKATRERMRLVGFRTGADGDENGDKAAREIMSANGLKVGSGDLHSWLLLFGRAYAIVGPATNDSAGLPLITVEDPRQVITAHAPENPRRAAAALKWVIDDIAGQEVAYLYLPGRVYRAFREAQEYLNGQSARYSGVPLDFVGWEWDDRYGGASGKAIPTAGVPVVRFANEDMLGEFEPHLPLVDRINRTILDRMTIAAVQAYRQRAIKGLPTHDAEGNELDYAGVFSPSAGSLWQLPEGAEMWESQQADLQGILQATKDDVRDLAAVTSTPLYFIFPDAANGSAEGASTMREALVFKAEDRIFRAAEGWANVMSLAFEVAGDTERANILEMEAIFQPAERFSLAERSSAAAQLATVLPLRNIRTDVLQYAPAEVDRMASEDAVDALNAALRAPAPPAATPAEEPSAADV